MRNILAQLETLTVEELLTLQDAITETLRDKLLTPAEDTTPAPAVDTPAPDAPVDTPAPVEVGAACEIVWCEFSEVIDPVTEVATTPATPAVTTPATPAEDDDASEVTERDREYARCPWIYYAPKPANMTRAQRERLDERLDAANVGKRETRVDTITRGHHPAPVSKREYLDACANAKRPEVVAEPQPATVGGAKAADVRDAFADAFEDARDMLEAGAPKFAKQVAKTAKPKTAEVVVPNLTTPTDGMTYRDAQALAKRLRNECDERGINYSTPKHVGWDNVRTAVDIYVSLLAS